jgi:hypothetical protein
MLEAAKWLKSHPAPHHVYHDQESKKTCVLLFLIPHRYMHSLFGWCTSSSNVYVL